MNLILALPILIRALALFTITLLFVVSRLSYAESVNPPSPQPRIGGIYLQAALNQERSGFYDEIMKRALKTNGISHKYVVAPATRIFREFQTGKLDCVFPISPKLARALDPEGKIRPFIYSSAFHKVTYYKYFKTRNPEFGGSESLPRIIGVPHRSETALRYFQLNPTDTIVSSSVDMMVKQIHRGRADAIIYAHPLPLYWSAKLNLGELYYDDSSPVLTDELAIGCHKTESNRKFLGEVSQQIDELWKTGFIGKLMSEMEAK